MGEVLYSLIIAVLVGLLYFTSVDGHVLRSVLPCHPILCPPTCDLDIRNGCMYCRCWDPSDLI